MLSNVIICQNIGLMELNFTTNELHREECGIS